MSANTTAAFACSQQQQQQQQQLRWATMNDPERRRRRNTVESTSTLATKVVTTAVVAYGAYRLFDYFWKNNSNTTGGSQSRNNTQNIPSSNLPQRRPTSASYALQRRRREDRLARCQRECAQAWNALAAALAPVIDEATDTKEATQRIKELRAAVAANTDKSSNNTEEQAKLWETVKIRTVTRWITTVYAQTLLMLVLQVQVHLWGAQLWQELQSQDETTAATASVARMESYRQAHQTVLQQTFKHFFQTGLPALCATVQKATAEVLADWNVFDPAYLHVSQQIFVEQVIQKIAAIVEERNVRASCRRSLWRFFVPTHNNHYNQPDMEEEEDPLLAETWDWLESPLLADALQATLTITFEYGTRDCLPWSTMENPQDATLSLAQILPQLKKVVKGLHARPEHPLWTRVQALPEVQEIGQLCFP